MNNNKKDKFARIWSQSRTDAGKSQQYVADALGVSRKTVQNWESGYSSPSQLQGFQWFEVLGLQPLPYYLNVIYETFDGISPTTDDKAIEAALISYIHGCTNDERRKILYFLYGDHGSSPAGVIDLITAYLHTPLLARLNVAANIITNYELAKLHNYQTNPQHIQPNFDFLVHSYENAKAAVMEGKNSYTNTKELTK